MYFGTIDQFYQLHSPPDALWPTNRVRLGAIPIPTHLAGAGTGTMDVRGNAHGNYTVRAECVTAGQVNSSAGVNPGALPTFKLSVDGTTYTRAFVVSEDDDVAVLRDEMTGQQWGLIFEFRGAFLVGDRWGTTAAPSPDVEQQLEVAASFLRGKLSNTLKQPLTTAPPAVIYVQGAIALWALIRRAGLDSRQDMKLYSLSEPRGELAGLTVEEQVRAWIQGEDLGEFESGDNSAILFPSFVSPTPQNCSFLKI